MKLNVEQIRMDGGTQPREQINEDAVEAYVEALRRAATFPPIEVCFDGSVYWLIDGFHRLTAYHRLDIPAIEAVVHQGTQADAQWMSCGVNDANGLFRSNEDKRRAVRVALGHPKSRGMSNPAIAAHCKVSDEMVREMRRRIQPPEPGEKRLGADGKNRPASLSTGIAAPAPGPQAASDPPPNPAVAQSPRPAPPIVNTVLPAETAIAVESSEPESHPDEDPGEEAAREGEPQRYTSICLPLDSARIAATILIDDMGEEYARQVINEAQEILWPESAVAS